MEWTKRCARCREVKPWADYHAHTRWDDGTTRYPQSRCKACMVVVNRLSRRARRLAGLERRDWEAEHARLRSNPERLGVKRLRDRERLRALNSIPPERWRMDRPEPRLVGGGVCFSRTLPAAPFHVWLRALIDRCEGYADAGALLGMDPSRLQRLTTEDPVSLSTVDRVLLAAGDGTSLDDLYPLERAA